MPGAPNRPPEGAVPVAPPTPAADERSRRIVRRLAVDRVALWQDTWKGAPPPDLLTPLERAESCYASGDLAGAETALDLIMTRFAEPRWPTMPTPFRNLRVTIPPPMPPSWDPENALPAAERDARRAHREMESYLAILSASLAWASAHGIDASDLAPSVESSRTAYAAGSSDPELFAPVDRAAQALRERVAMPSRAAPRPAPPPPSAPAIEEA